MTSKNVFGFTLIELLVTVVILSILSSVGIPSFTKMIKNSRQSATYNALISDLSFARSEAVKRSSMVVVCSRNTDSSCQSSTDWADGWLVYSDDNSNGTLDGGEEVLKTSTELNADQALTQKNFATAGIIQYQPRGNTLSTGHFVICDDRGVDRAKAVNIVITGAIRKATDSDSNNIVETLTGTDVTC